MTIIHDVITMYDTNECGCLTTMAGWSRYNTSQFELSSICSTAKTLFEVFVAMSLASMMMINDSIMNFMSRHFNGNMY